jgi:precorrin-4 methylase
MGKRDFQYFQSEIGYLVQPHTHLCLWLGVTQVDELKTSLDNAYKSNTTGQIVTFKITSDICYRAFDF